MEWPGKMRPELWFKRERELGWKEKEVYSEYPTTGKGVQVAMRMDVEREREVASLFGQKDHDHE